MVSSGRVLLLLPWQMSCGKEGRSYNRIDGKVRLAIYRHVWSRTGEHLGKLFPGHGFAKEVPLIFVAALLSEKCQLRLSLHAFRHDS